jgi:hypothetical protein
MPPPPTPPPNYSANTRAEIARAGRTQASVRNDPRVGLTGPQWTRRMHGDVDWRAHELQAVADVLGVDVARLYKPEGACHA